MKSNEQAMTRLTEYDDLPIRLRLFDWLKEQTVVHGDVLPRSLLEKGFAFGGAVVPLVAPNGIFKPRLMSLPLTITTTVNGPYEDTPTEEGLFLYRYRGTGADAARHPDNVGMREVARRQLPLAYFHGVMPGRYVPLWPVYVVGDDPKDLAFIVAVDDEGSVAAASGTGNSTGLHHAATGGRGIPVSAGRLSRGASLPSAPLPGSPLPLPASPRQGDSVQITVRRGYVTALARKRLHQRGFREIVLRAYREQCAFCRLRHLQLLDAAHILPDSEPDGKPEVRNGLSLCKLHHAAYDSLLVGVSPDYAIEVRPDILAEADGPMLEHGLKEFHGLRISRPHRVEHQPSRELLEVRYGKFRGQF